jgi:hypothetical protein
MKFPTATDGVCSDSVTRGLLRLTRPMRSLMSLVLMRVVAA